MDNNDYFKVLRNKFPVNDDDPFLAALQENCTVLTLEKNELLIRYHADNKKMFFIVSGSFIRSIITSRGEEKTVMFHTEDFLEFVKAYDTVYFHERTNYEIKANEKSVVIAFDYYFMYQAVSKQLNLLLFFTEKTEELLKTIDLFRNFQLGLTSDEYLSWLYENYGFLFQRFPAQSIASFMGITPVWLSKLKARSIS